jgi:hypothetical protein
MQDIDPEMLKKFLERAKRGDFSSADLISDEQGPFHQALTGRNLTESALASEVMKNTGIPTPSRYMSRLKQEDTLNRFLAEQYPEMKDHDVRVMDLDEHKARGLYGTNEKTGKKLIAVHKKLITKPEELLGTLFHEGGHKYDDDIIGNVPNNEILKSETGQKAIEAARQGKRIDPVQLYEDVTSAGHHAFIPDKRPGSFGLGALKSLLKSGNFKSLAPPIIGGLATAAMTGDATAAIPGLGDADNVGSSTDDRIMKGEDKSRKDLANIEKSDVPKEVKLKALELYRKNNIY